MAKEIMLFAVVLLFNIVCGSVGAATLESQCSEEFPKVMTCLDFAKGKAQAPTPDCCKSVTGIKDNNPACLCFIIEQIHNGTNSQIKSMGIQEARLLQLPSACQVANASITDCPKLLNLPPNSPEAAIFTNNSTTSSPTTGITTPSTAGSSNNGYKYEVPHLAGSVLLTMAVLFYAFPAGQFGPMSWT